MKIRSKYKFKKGDIVWSFFEARYVKIEKGFISKFMYNGREVIDIMYNTSFDIEKDGKKGVMISPLKQGGLTKVNPNEKKL